MSGWLTDGFPQRAPFSGSEQLSIDTEQSGGAQPQTAMSTLMQLATALKWLANAEDKTMVAGTRYYVNYVLGSDATLTGIEVLVGGTGGTDLWTFERDLAVADPTWRMVAARSA